MLRRAALLRHTPLNGVGGASPGPPMDLIQKAEAPSGLVKKRSYRGAPVEMEFAHIDNTVEFDIKKEIQAREDAIGGHYWSSYGQYAYWDHIPLNQSSGMQPILPQTNVGLLKDVPLSEAKKAQLKRKGVKLLGKKSASLKKKKAAATAVNEEKKQA
eukprot:PhM_4_TR12817/c0_g1_i1/m.72769